MGDSSRVCLIQDSLSLFRMNCFRAFSLVVACLVISLSDLGSSRLEGYEEIVNEIVNDRTFGQFQQKIQDWQACQTTYWSTSDSDLQGAGIRHPMWPYFTYPPWQPWLDATDQNTWRTMKLTDLTFTCDSDSWL